MSAGEDRKMEAKEGQVMSKDQAVYAKGGRYNGEGGGCGKRGNCRQEKIRCSS